MAPNSKVKAFTVLESIIVIFLFMTAITISSQIYFNLVKVNLQSQDLQLAFDNARFGAEKIWIEVKAGSEFSPDSERLVFKNRRCQEVEIYRENGNLFFVSSGKKVPIFDENLVSIKNFKIYYDEPTSSDKIYYQASHKIFVFDYDLELKTKNGNVPFSFRQTVAPSNSVLLNKPCQ